MNNASLFKSISTATLGSIVHASGQPAASQEKTRRHTTCAPAEDGRARHSQTQEVAVYEGNMLQADQPPTLTSRQRYLLCPAQAMRAGSARRNLC